MMTTLKNIEQLLPTLILQFLDKRAAVLFQTPTILSTPKS